MKGCLVSLALAAAIIGLCIFGLTQCLRVPTDKELRDYFRGHKATYCALVDMMHEDKSLRRICQGEVAVDDPKDAVSDELCKPIEQTSFSRVRYYQYEKLISEVDAKSISQDADGTVLFVKGGIGMAGNGPRWGYIWLPFPPPSDEVLESLDDFKKIRDYREDSRRYVYLENQWYIFALDEG